MIQKLFDKYKEHKIPNKFTLQEVDSIFKKKYNAVEIDKQQYTDLNKDLYINYKKIVKLYKIEDKDVLSNLFSDEEKNNFIEMIKENSNYPIHPEEDYNKALEQRNLQEGKLLLIFLESENGKYISDFTLLGQCEKLYNELVVFKGIVPDECDIKNENFVHYLEALLKAGYIKE
jgi:hypothetical protein